ncbi:MAG: MFS transporter [Opitutaceae bacterium]
MKIPTPDTIGSPNAPKKWKAGTLTYTSAGLAVLFIWLLFGDFAWQLKERSVTATAQLFLKRFESSDFFVGLLIGSLPAAMGMIIGPIISVRSDRHRGRWGRRIPYLLVPLPFVTASMVGLALSPQVGGFFHQLLGDTSPGLNACVLGAFAGFWALFEVATVIANAVFGGLINDVVPQAIIGRFFALFRIVSLIDGIIFNYFLIKHAEEYFVWIFIGTGVFYAIGFSLMCFMVKEGEYPPPEPLSETAKPGRMQGLRSYLRECFATPYYLWIFVALTLCMLSFGPVNSFSIFYAKSLDMSMQTYGRYIAASYACSIILAYFLGSLADRFHPLRMAIATIGLYAGFMLWGAGFATDSPRFGVAFIAHTVISGAYFTSTASIGQRLYPKMKFAQFASAAGILIAATAAVLPPTVGLILDASGHQYRLTFLMGGILASTGLLILLVVHHKFMKLGGPKNYKAPHADPVAEVA